MFRRLVRVIYNRILRPYLPKKFGVWNGIPARTEGLLDFEDRHPQYKQGLIDAIYKEVEKDSKVVLVGGGRGISTAHCLRAGAGEVVAYEASAEMLDVAKETIEIQEESGKASLVHAIVGDAVEIYGAIDGAEEVSPAELDTGDLLLLDCEGAERSILESIIDHPQKVIVETHPERGVPTDDSKELLKKRGYTVSSRQYQPGAEDKRVLIGKKSG
jgi:hypothetical protein